MADSLSPWLSNYLLGIAESFGAKYYDAPRHVKPKKVQLNEFLTYPTDQEPTQIWARVSDKKHLVIVKFTEEAVTDFNQSSTRFTQNKGALIKISKFKPFFTQYPINGGGISRNAAICLDCEQVSLLGGAGEPTFGQPRDIHQDPDIKVWVQGLAQHGGAGNILKERKMERKAEPPKPTSMLPPIPTPARPDEASLSAKAASTLPRVPVEATVQPPRAKIIDLESYTRFWKHFEYLPESPRVEEKLLSSMTSRSDSNVKRSRSLKQASQEMPKPSTDSSSLPAPTPAQCTRLKDTPEQPLSSLRSLDETQVSPSRRVGMARKVPCPASPEPAGEKAGPVRVLVANSDIGSQPNHLEPSSNINSKVLPWLRPSQVGDIMRRTMRHRLHNKEYT